MPKQAVGLAVDTGSSAQPAPLDPAAPVNRQEIAELAYGFWQDRGCPDGSPDEDWFRAEREIQNRRSNPS